MRRQFDVSRHELPLATTFIDELIALWENLFQSSFQQMHPILRGEEASANVDVIYAARDGDQLAATCHLTVPGTDPRLGGLGEVAVPNVFRRQGLASTLCEQARDEFFHRGGEALLLGTVNPAARRIYERLGWATLRGSTVMVNNRQHLRSDEFLEDWLQQGSSLGRVKQVDAGIRVPMIPLALADHPWTMLDANVALYSTRHVCQNSCMGLYPRYEQVMGTGAVLGLWSDDGVLLGLASVKIGGDVAQIDGFTFGFDNNPERWRELIDNAIGLTYHYGVNQWNAVVAATDESKREAFRAIGFENIGRGSDMVIDDHTIETRRYRLGEPSTT